MLHTQHPPNREPQIPQYFVVQIQMETLVKFEFVLRNFSFSIWWISGVALFSGNYMFYFSLCEK